jgi:hypothetical protein
MAHNIAFHAVTVTDRPTVDCAPVPGGYATNPAVLTPAKDVVAGDLVLGYVLELTPGGRQVVDYHSDAYPAAPVPHNPACGCPGHQALTDEDATGPLTVLTDSFPWDACDVMPSDALVLIVPAAKLPPAKKEAAAVGFTHNDFHCTAYKAAKGWKVLANGQVLVTRRPDRETAIRDAKAILDGDESTVTGWDTLARLLAL